MTNECFPPFSFHCLHIIVMSQVSKSAVSQVDAQYHCSYIHPHCGGCHDSISNARTVVSTTKIQCTVRGLIVSLERLRWRGSPVLDLIACFFAVPLQSQFELLAPFCDSRIKVLMSDIERLSWIDIRSLHSSVCASTCFPWSYLPASPYLLEFIACFIDLSLVAIL